MKKQKTQKPDGKYTLRKEKNLHQRIICIVTQPNSAVRRTHMLIDTLAPWESFRTHPADMCLTPGARNMITPLRTFNGDFASRAILHIVLFRPLLESDIFVIAVWTVRPIMLLDMTCRTNPYQA